MRIASRGETGGVAPILLGEIEKQLRISRRD
jgi:hypothetical protein